MPTDAVDDREVMWPKRRREIRAGRSTYASLHGAFHRISQRVQRELFPWQLSPAEAIVLAAARFADPVPVWMLRRDTGLRGSTLSSILQRLERRALIVRTRAPDDPRAVDVSLTAEGHELARTSAATFAELDLELATFTRYEDRAGVDAVDEASAVMIPGPAPPDY